MKIKRELAVIMLAALVMTGCGSSKEVRDLDDGSSTEGSETVTDGESEDTQEEQTENEADESESEENGETAAEEEVDEAVVESAGIQVDVIDDSASYSYYDESTGYYRNVARCEAESVVLADEYRDVYPELAKTLDEKAAETKETVKSSCEEYKSSYESDADFKQQMDEYDMTLEDNTSCSVVRADSKVLSVCSSYYSFSGGAHGMYGKGGYNYDPVTGEKLKFSDVVTDTQGFFETANEKIQEQYSGESESPMDLTEYLKDYDEDLLSWWVDYTGVTLYFGPYELGSYAMGAVQTKILFSEAPQLFNAEYTEVPDSYVMPISEGESLILDIDGDGVTDCISFTEVADDDSEYASDAYTATVVNVNGDEMTIEDWHYSTDDYVVCKDGRFFFMSFRIGDSDWNYCKAADLNDLKEIDESSKENGFAYYGYSSDISENDVDFYENTRSVFTDPDLIRMNYSADYLGTMNGNIDCCMDADGVIVNVGDEMVLFGTYNAIKALKDVPCKRVDYDGNVESDDTLSAGSYYIVVRGDGKTYADLMEVPASDINDLEYYYSLKEPNPAIDESSVLYRVEGQRGDDDYMLYIGGETESDLFEGLFYAG